MQRLAKRKRARYNAKKCSKCKLIKDFSEFHKNSSAKDKLEYQKNYEKIQRQEDINHKLICYLRSRLYKALKNNQKSRSAVKDLGCSIEDLKIWLEQQFKRGMTWGNWGKDGWHIDHIIPLSSVNLTDRKQLKRVCHWFNLQPLWAKDNLSKGNKINAY